ncbi:unnamed protein product [Callosobruchus maculatus]|uniref:Uncharacterized protein n=1 Tax=Callosobruchus maculatus TaxID=64391 RepID=A0A653D8V4_CALMS|nr:unnamed protein product [Callosobruchus maculatus]
MTGHQYDSQPQTNQPKKQEETKDYTQAVADAKSQAAQIEHLIKTTFAQASLLQQEPLGTKTSFSQQALASVPVTSQYAAPFSGDPSYPLNIPSTRNIAAQQSKIDLSKYTNMGYTGPDINYTRSLQQFAQQTQTTINSVISQKPTSVASTAISQASSVARYGNPLQQMTNQRVHTNFGANLDRLAQVQDVANEYKADAVPKSSYGGGTAGMTVEQQLALGAGRELAHIVDRLSGEERLMAGTAGSHIFNKPIATSASALPIFSQGGSIVAGMQSYAQGGQSTATTMYNRQMAELMQQQQQQSEQQKPNVQEKKSKRKKSSKSGGGASSTDQQQQQQQQLASSAQQQQQQGFQSYAGLKGLPGASAEAIALKTSSVVPGSAFNFGPTTAGLAGLYAAADKDAYPNFLEEFRAAAPNYYMAAAQAARHRSTPDKVATDKQQQSRTAVAAHQSSTGQPSASAAATYPAFLGATPAHHQSTRSAYPPTIGAPFISNAQAAQLMDTSSPLYQQYIQAGLLNQGLLGPPGAYPPGYHPALSLRQPYDSMTRPSWL